jgi:hypothetical protein
MAKFTMMEVEAILNRLAGEKAERFQREVLYPQLARAMRIPLPDSPAVRDALADPYYAFRAMLGYYAFAKRGNDRAEYSGFALQALDKVLKGDKANFSKFLASGDAPEQLWNAFVAVCQEHQRKINEQLNRGLIEGLAGYAARLYAEDDIGNIWMDIQQAIVQSGRVEPIYQKITEIKGIGPKVGALVLRDMVALYDLESTIEPRRLPLPAARGYLDTAHWSACERGDRREDRRLGNRGQAGEVVPSEPRQRRAVQSGRAVPGDCGGARFGASEGLPAVAGAERAAHGRYRRLGAPCRQRRRATCAALVQLATVMRSHTRSKRTKRFSVAIWGFALPRMARRASIIACKSRARSVSENRWASCCSASRCAENRTRASG